MTAISPRTTQHLSPILTLKALLMAHYQPQRTLEAIVKLMLSAPALSLPTDQFLNAQRNLMNNWNANDNNDELKNKLTMAQVSVDQQLHALQAAPLEDKQIVLASMPVIDAEHAAYFLRIPELALHHFNMFYHDIFGQQYMNRCHYSLDELTLIARNPEWLSNHRKWQPMAATPMPGDPEFHRWTVVEEKLAMAFCNVTRDELPKVANVTNKVSVYYLADLDEIRVAKLKAQQQ